MELLIVNEIIHYYLKYLCHKRQNLLQSMAGWTVPPMYHYVNCHRTLTSHHPKTLPSDGTWGHYWP